MKTFLAGFLVLFVFAAGVLLIWEIAAFIVWLCISYPLGMLLAFGAFVLVYFAQRWRIDEHS